MAKFPARHIVLGGVLVVTLVACFYPLDEPAAHVPRVARAAFVAPLPTTVSATLSEPVNSGRVDVDPFAPRAWQAEPPPVVMVVTPVVVAVDPFVGPMPSPPPPPAPPLPFQFMGQLTDDGIAVVYLSHGDKTLVARTGDTLDQTYKVLSMAPRLIEFQYLPTGEKQLMSLPASNN